MVTNIFVLEFYKAIIGKSIIALQNCLFITHFSYSPFLWTSNIYSITGIFVHVPFLSLDQGPVEFGKKHLGHQNWENFMQSKRTGLPFLNGLKSR